MIDYSDQDFYNLVRNLIIPQYYRWTRIQEIYELDDLVQEAILWWYQPMKNGEQRLLHYKKSCKSEAHLENIVKLSICQYIPGLLRLKDIQKHLTNVSLNKTLTNDTESKTELQDLIPDETVNVSDDALYNTQLDKLKEVLNIEQQMVLKDLLENYTKSELSLKYKDFYLDLKIIQKEAKDIFK